MPPIATKGPLFFLHYLSNQNQFKAVPVWMGDADSEQEWFHFIVIDHGRH